MLPFLLVSDLSEGGHELMQLGHELFLDVIRHDLFFLVGRDEAVVHSFQQGVQINVLLDHSGS